MIYLETFQNYFYDRLRAIDSDLNSPSFYKKACIMVGFGLGYSTLSTSTLLTASVCTGFGYSAIRFAPPFYSAWVRAKVFDLPEAKFELAMMYDRGEGVTRDPQAALSLFQQAAEQGNADAQNHLGSCYFYGWGGVAIDYDRARYFLQQAAEQGNAEAQYHLGSIYQYGYGVARNLIQARALFQQAAAQGNADALFHLGNIYRFGIGVEANAELAHQHYSNAALNGKAAAFVSLGLMHENGVGVPASLGKAVEYYRRAAREDAPGAKQQFLRLNL